MSLNIIPITTEEAYDRMYNDLMAVVGNVLYPGDERLIFAKAILLSKAQEYAELNAAARQTWLDYAYGEYLEAIGALFSVDRAAAAYATCKVQFYINNGQYEGTAPVTDGTAVFTEVATIVDTESGVTLISNKENVDFEEATYDAENATLTVTGILDTVEEVDVMALYAYPEPITVPEGTQVTSDSQRYFETLETVTLQPGKRITEEVTVKATEPGVDYNDILVGAITTVVNLYNVPLIPDVRNVTVTSGGDDAQSDDVYRETIRIAPNKTTTAGPEGNYKYWTMQADASIKDVFVISPQDTNETEFPDIKKSINYKPGITGTPGEVFIYPLCEGGELPTEVILDKVLAMFGMDGEGQQTRQDLRPLTDYVHVYSPRVTRYKFSVTPYVSVEYATTAQGDVTEAAEEYKTWQADKLGRDINPDRLRLLALAVDGVQRVDVKFSVAPTVEATDETAEEEVVYNPTTYTEVPFYSVAQCAGYTVETPIIIDDGEVYVE